MYVEGRREEVCVDTLLTFSTYDLSQSSRCMFVDHKLRKVIG